MAEQSVLERALERERTARKQVERILEDKSRELYLANTKLQETFDELARESARVQSDLAERVAERTKELEESKTLAEQNAESFRESENRIRGIINSVADGIVTVDHDLNPRTINASAEVMFQVSLDRLKGSPFSSLIEESFELGVDGEIIQIQENGTKNLGTKAELTGRRGGGTFPVSISVSAIQYESEQHYVLLLHDETKRREADLERQRLNEELVVASRRAGMAEIATGVLRNVGNVLNSVNVCSSMIREIIENGAMKRVNDVASLYAENSKDFAGYLANDEKGRQLAKYIGVMITSMVDDRVNLLDESIALRRNIDHIKNIVAAQQSNAKLAGVKQEFDPAVLIEESLLAVSSIAPNLVVKKELDDCPVLVSDKHKVFQILVNLISNANQAITEAQVPNGEILLRLKFDKELRKVMISVKDNGQGISVENMEKIFNHGFTTKETGHGFGLHSCANAAVELGGSLQAYSDGVGTGATFVLEIPIGLLEHEAKSD